MLENAAKSFHQMVERLRREWGWPKRPPPCPPDPRLLMFRAIQRRDAAAFHDALSRGADVNKPFRAGRTPLMFAARHGWVDGVRELLERGVDVRRRDDLGYSAIGIAYWYGEYRMMAYTPQCLQIVELLRAAGSPE